MIRHDWFRYDLASDDETEAAYVIAAAVRRDYLTDPDDPGLSEVVFGAFPTEDLARINLSDVEPTAHVTVWGRDGRLSWGGSHGAWGFKAVAMSMVLRAAIPWAQRIEKGGRPAADKVMADLLAIEAAQKASQATQA